MLSKYRKWITLQPVFYKCSMANCSGDSCKVSLLLAELVVEGNSHICFAVSHDINMDKY